MGNFLTELIYKEVMNSEEKTKNGVVKGQPSPSGTHSQWITHNLVPGSVLGSGRGRNQLRHFLNLWATSMLLFPHGFNFICSDI